MLMQRDHIGGRRSLWWGRIIALLKFGGDGPLGRPSRPTDVHRTSDGRLTDVRQMDVRRATASEVYRERDAPRCEVPEERASRPH